MTQGRRLLIQSCDSYLVCDETLRNFDARQADKDECAAAGFDDARDAVMSAIGTSEESYAVGYPGECPIAYFGVGHTNGILVPWFLGTDEVYENKRAWVYLKPQDYIRRWWKRFPGARFMTNIVGIRNFPAHKLIKHLGGTVTYTRVTSSYVPGFTWRVFTFPRPKD